MNICEIVSRRAADRPGSMALEALNRRFTYRELDQAVGHVACHLARRGVAPGQLVAVGMRTSAVHMIVLLALARLGAVSMTITPGGEQEWRDAIARRFGPAVLLSMREEHGVAGVPFLRVEPEWLRVPESFRPDPAASGGDAPWRLNLSSGTTGGVKGVTWGHAAFVALLERCQEFFPLPPGSRLLCNRGMDASFVLRFCMSSLFCGNTIVFENTRSLTQFVEVVRRREVTHAVVTPAYLQALVDNASDLDPSLPRLQALVVGGGVMPASLLEAAMVKVTPNIYDSLGASETLLTAIGDPELRRTHPEVTGRVAPWIEAQAVDESDRPLPEGTAGILRYRSPLFPIEYYKDSKATAQGFRDGWFYPGDFGAVAGGLLTVQSRVDETINLAGVKVNPIPIEAALVQHANVAEAAVFAVRPADGPPALAAAIVTRGEATDQDLIEFCRARLGKWAPRAIVRVPRLPRNEAGKLLRRELSSLAAASGFGTDVG